MDSPVDMETQFVNWSVNRNLLIVLSNKVCDRGFILQALNSSTANISEVGECSMR